jgi:tetratricopeptide (TPR) repeat protein
LRDAASAAVARAGRPVVQRDADDRPVSGAGSEVVSAREVLVVDLDAEGLPAQLERALGATAAARAEVRLREAAKAFGAERFEEAARLLRPVAQRAPGIPAVRELYGLTLYRLGRWRAAARELEAFRVLAGSTEQHPVLADCYRAMQRWRLVDELWAELRAASPSAELVTEGRIVAAGALADRGELPAAIRLLGQGFRFPRHPRVHHLRRAYALADLYERAGDIPQARDLFERVAGADPGFVDAAARARSLA